MRNEGKYNIQNIRETGQKVSDILEKFEQMGETFTAKKKKKQKKRGLCYRQ